MVKKLVAEAYTSEGYKEIGRALGKLKKIRLHRIQSEEAIEATCHEVMKLISGPNPTLVHLTADMLISLKSESLRQVTKAKMKGVIAPPPPIPVAMTEVQINAQEAQI